VVGNQLKTSGDLGLMNTTLGFAGVAGLPLAIATTAITHLYCPLQLQRDECAAAGPAGRLPEIFFSG